MIKNKLTLVLLSGISFLYANTQISSIDIYNNKTILNQQLSLDKKSVDLVGDVKFEDVQFILGKTCKVLKEEFKVVDAQENEIEKMISKIEENISKVQSKKKALLANINYLGNLQVQNLQTIEVLQKSSEFITSEITANYDEIYTLDKKIKEYEKEIDKLKKTIPNSKFTKLDYEIDCKDQDKVTISYPTTLVKVQRTNELSYDSTNKTIEFENNAFLTQNTGVDLKDIVVNFYVGNFYNVIKPYVFVPEYLDIQTPKPIALRSDMAMEAQSFATTKMLKTTNVREYVELTTKSVNKISKVTLPLNTKTKLVLSKEKLKAEDSIEIDGYSTSNPFFKVEFETDKIYNQSYVQLYLDGVDIGKNYIDKIEKNKKSSIYFGTNNFINIEKELIKDMKEEPFFSINVLKTQRVWKYTIKNESKDTQKITLLERVPVSKHEDIKVKVIGETKYSKLDKNGKIYYDFELKPNEEKVIEFGYEIEKPAKSK